MKWSRLVNGVANGLLAVALVYVAAGPRSPVRRMLEPHVLKVKQSRFIARHWDQLVTSGDPLPTRPGARLTLIEFSDYQCQYCGQQDVALARLLEQHPEVELRLIHFPLPFHKHADEAARAALCAQTYGAFESMHRRLFEAAPSWSDTVDWEAHAAAVGVADLAAFRGCLRDPMTMARLDSARHLAAGLGIRGTPAFVSKAGVHRGFLSDSAFGVLIDELQR